MIAPVQVLVCMGRCRMSLNHARAVHGYVCMCVPAAVRFEGYEPQGGDWHWPVRPSSGTRVVVIVCVVTGGDDSYFGQYDQDLTLHVTTGTLVSMTVTLLARDGLSRACDMAGGQNRQCVVVTVGGHTVLFVCLFSPSPFGCKPSFFVPP